MTSKERFEAAINFEDVDRVPLAYLFFGAGNKVLEKMGVSFKDVYYSSKGIANAQIKAKEMFDHDNVMSPWGCLTVEAEALGSKIKVKANDYPRISEHVLKNIKDVKDLVIAYPQKDGRMPIVLESLKILKKQLGKDTFVIGMVCSPIMVAGNVLDETKLFIEILSNPDLVHELLDLCTTTCIDYANAMISEGVDAIMIENGENTKELLSPEQSDDFVVKYNKKLVDIIKAEKLPVVIHNCSSIPYVDKDLSMKPDVLSFAYGDVVQIKNKYDFDCPSHHKIVYGCRPRYCITELRKTNKICLLGNVDHTNTIFKGTPENVLNEAKTCLKKAGERGYILSTGCEIPFDSPIENVRALQQSIIKKVVLE